MSNIAARIAELSPAKRALLEARLNAERDRVTPIAVIGMSCRFPGAPTVEAFRQMLLEGVDAVSEVPRDRWDVDAYYDSDSASPGKMTTRWGGFIDSVDRFDAGFFGISPREASRMDPQQRLAMQVAWEALEDAGQVAARLTGSATGVFIGIATSDYGTMQVSDVNGIDGHSGTGSAMSIAANRLSYFFDFRGPSMAVDTACSSSLVAVHLACQSLWRGESTMALAGGVNLILAPWIAINFSKAGAMAPDGRCKAFDARANGYVRGEGAGIVVLKPLSAALADGDPVHAVIRGSAVNQDGRTNGLMAPNRYSQEAVLREAYRAAGVSPASVQFVETHGTGTLLGDPIEAAALGAVLGAGRPADRPCVLGSVKTNIGHLEAAAGIAGLIKTVLALKHRQIPRNLHFVQPNPHIPFDTLPLRVVTETESWDSPEGPRLAGVSSFGFGGTNSHVVLEEAPELTGPESTRGDQSLERCLALPISARTPEALRETVLRYRDLLASTNVSLADLCYTAAVRRSHHDCRLALAVHSKEEAREFLDAFLAGESRPGMAAGSPLSGRRRKLVFVFSGQGSQWHGMGRQLMARYPVFQDAIERCGAAEALLTDTPLTEIDAIQPALFAIQVALCRLWKSWGVEPDAVVGHSMGEIAAAHVAGALSLEDALRIVCRRSHLMKSAGGSGAMAVVELTLEQAQRALEGYEDRLSVAASNSPVSTAISGDRSALLELTQALEAKGIFCRLVKVDVAAHSPQLDPLREKMLASLSGVVSLVPPAPAIPFFSTVQSGSVDTFDADYWWRNLRGTVHFTEAVDRLLDSGHDLFLEVSPHPILAVSLLDSLRAKEREGTVLCSLRREADEEATLLAALGGLYAEGWPVDWSKQYEKPRRVAPLPLYPWQQERCWFRRENGVRSASPARAEGLPLLGVRLCVAGATDEDRWENGMSLETIPAFVRDHKVQGAVVLPGAGYIEMALAASGIPQPVIQHVEFRKALFLAGDADRSVQTVLSGAPGESRTFRVYSRLSGSTNWMLHAEGTIGSADAAPAVHNESLESPDAIRQRLTEQMDGAEFYAITRNAGNDYGPAHQGIAKLWRGEREVLAEIRVPESVESDLAQYRLHPALLDAVWQALGPLAAAENTASVPVHIDRIEVRGIPGGHCWSHATFNGECGDVHLLDENGHRLVSTFGLRLRALDAGPERGIESDDWLYELCWRQRPPVARAVPARGSWIVMGGSGDVAGEVRRLLIARGDTVTGEIALGTTGRGVVYIAESAEESGSVPERAQAECASVLSAMQSLAGGRLWIVTTGAQPIEKTAGLAVCEAPLWGLGRVFAQEQPALWGGLIDLDPEAPAVTNAAAVLAELDRADNEDQVGCRNGNRYVARLERKQRSAPTRDYTWRPDAAYLITGGLGDLGLEVARWMVERGARQLILLSRGAPADDRMRALREIEAMGARLTVAPVDVADEAQFAAFLERYRAGDGAPIRGAIHAAGIVQVKNLADVTPEELGAVLRPKVAGAWNLHRLLRDAELDFFVLFSSFASLLSSPQLGAYAAANAFLDGLAHLRRSEGRPALSINWAAWSQVGMAARYLQGGHSMARGAQSFTPAQGLAVLGNLMNRDSPQVGVMRVDWPTWAKMYPAFTAAPLIADLIVAERASRDTARQADPIRHTLLAADPRSRQELLEGYLRAAAARVLGLAVAKMETNRSLTALGFDSLMAVELRNRVETDLQVTLPLVELLQGPSVAALAASLLQHVTAAALLTRDPERAAEPAVDSEWETITL